MSTIARRALTVWIALALSVVCLPSTALCIGDDGHLAIEAIGASCVDADTARTSVEADTDRSIHGCIDTPLGARGLRETSYDATLMPSLAAVRLPGVHPEIDRWSLQVAAIPLRAHPGALALSSVLIV